MPVVSGRKRQRARVEAPPPMVEAARGYGEIGWPCVPGATPGVDRFCSCDRIGCPDPGAHPVSKAWAHLASVDGDVLTRLWAAAPDANVMLPTGRVFDVFDVPAAAGALALARIAAEGLPVGPVAAIGTDRHLFFVATRGAPVDEDEWWTCQLDTSPATVADTPGMRWHCRDSYVPAPPSMLPFGRAVTWIHPPGDAPLPDPLRLLTVLSESCEP
ncbi:bifunctional DNA primase/polymerase [Actinomadura flavalba]|uniref:bifunctional DNA primase/polymerase n=1 Tax=Actinomadura flavalba TaxID=1120938 RepID=UPI00047812E5|nr:bifunctional DNA primase/polymerase [Actinomadura flavalba]